MLDLLDITERRAAYANSVEMVANAFEIRLLFSLSSPNGQKSRSAEVIMPPIVAKVLSKLLPDRIKIWENDFGFINIPEDVQLLEELFNVKLRPAGPPQPPSEDPNDKGN